jgi:hypothetical protein
MSLIILKFMVDDSGAVYTGLSFLDELLTGLASRSGYPL